MRSCNARTNSTHQQDAIARWRLNPYNPCDQAECLLTSYRVIKGRCHPLVSSYTKIKFVWYNYELEVQLTDDFFGNQ